MARLDEHDPTSGSSARARFGGIDPAAVLGGTMASLGTLLLLATLAGAIGQIGYEQGTGDRQVSSAALGSGLVVLGLALGAGGYVCGRMARFEGKRNGLLSGVLFVLLSAGVAALVSQSDRVRDLDLPRFVDTGSMSVAAVASAVTALIVALVSAVVGGRFGAAYHRRVDHALRATAEPTAG